MLQGFMLGLANGTSCLAFCAPVFLPYLLGEGRTVGRNTLLLLQFLLGRLSGYLLFGLAAWQTGQWIQKSGARGFLMGAAYTILAGLLIAYGFSVPRPRCAAEGGGKWVSRITRRCPPALPATMGFLTGITLCPPFLAALADASSNASLIGSLVFFGAFYLGTTLFFLPFPFAGLLRKIDPVRIIGRLASGIMGLYYLYKGIVMLSVGLIS